VFGASNTRLNLAMSQRTLAIPYREPQASLWVLGGCIPCYYQHLTGTYVSPIEIVNVSLTALACRLSNVLHEHSGSVMITFLSLHNNLFISENKDIVLTMLCHCQLMRNIKCWAHSKMPTYFTLALEVHND